MPARGVHLTRRNAQQIPSASRVAFCHGSGREAGRIAAEREKAVERQRREMMRLEEERLLAEQERVLVREPDGWASLERRDMLRALPRLDHGGTTDV